MRRLSRDHVALGEAIRAKRRELGLSQTDLAARCGLHRTYVASVERGERNLGYANLLKIAAALDLRGAALVRRAEARRRAGRRP
ncbi:MAG TPA: helix-turn-helix transcriptional regulator [Thermoleophilaceae bacterium]|nr:helix-turn-helix transcriptional regulator [Thermoleophilaceae bacterium]